MLGRATWPARYAVDRRRHASFVSQALAHTELCRRAAAGEPLPAGQRLGAQRARGRVSVAPRLRFAYGAGGWQVSSLEGAAQARYRDPRSEGAGAPDRARAARAVACVRLVAG